MNLFERHARLNQLFQHSPVDAAYLTGSLASRATFGEMSDVDIAILLAEQIAADQFLDFQMYFLSELAKRLESDALDVVILNQASLLLRLQVVKYGQILYSRDEKKRSRFESRTVMDYLDFRQMDDMQNQALARRLRAPQLILDRELLHAALMRLRGAATQLTEDLAAPGAAEAFAVDPRSQAVIDRALLLAIEAMTQIATLLYAGMSIPQPEIYHEVLAPLAKRQILPASLVLSLEPLFRQRDLLLRTPDAIDRSALFALASAVVSDLTAFAGAIEHYLEPESPGF